MMNVGRTLFLLAALILGCGTAPSPVPRSGATATLNSQAPDTADRVLPTTSPNSIELPVIEPPLATSGSACWFAWRPSVETSFSERNRRAVRLRRAGDRERFNLGEFEIAVEASAATRGGIDLELSATSAGMILKDRFALSNAMTAGHLPPGGAGYTGLRYVSGAKGAQLQYYCGSVSPSDDLADESLAQRRPGASASRDAFVRCTFLSGGASPAAERIAEIGRSRQMEQVDAPFAAFTVGTSYVPGEHESGQLAVGAALPSGEGFHDALYLRGTDLPCNTFPQGGFTGQRSITDRSTGRTLTYQCSSVR